MGSAVVTLGVSCSTARGVFLDRGSNPCPLHWQADSYPLRHQGGLPFLMFVPKTKIWHAFVSKSASWELWDPPPDTKGPGGASPAWALDSGQTGLSTSRGTAGDCDLIPAPLGCRLGERGHGGIYRRENVCGRLQTKAEVWRSGKLEQINLLTSKSPGLVGFTGESH